MRKRKGWYCSVCDAIYFSPDSDSEHEKWHERIEIEIHNEGY